MVLPNNRAMALTCLNRLRKHLVNEPKLLEKYQAYIQEMIDCGQVDVGDSITLPCTWFLVAPFLLVAWCLVQGLFQENQLWDDLVTPTDVAAWSRWYSVLPAFESVIFLRCLLPCPSPYCVELHACSDASKNGMAWVVYLRVIFVEQTCVTFSSVSLVCA